MSGLAGTLSERVVIERRDPARDAGGGASASWLAIGTVWAKIVPDGHGPDVAGGARDARARWRVTVRPADVLVGDRLVRVLDRLLVTAIERDPRTPDRLLLFAETTR